MSLLTAWLTSPLLPAAVLIAGSILIWLAGRFLPSRRIIHGLLSVVLLLAAVAAIRVLCRPVSPAQVMLIFPPTLDVDLVLRMHLDPWGRLFGLLLLWPALALAWMTLSNLLTGAELADDSPLWRQWLPLLATAHVVLAAADLLTLTSALILFDLVYLASAAPRAERRQTFAANSLGNLAILVAAVMLSGSDHSLLLAGAAPLPGAAAWLITAAALIRLAPYPLHFWLTDSPEISKAWWRWPMRLASPILGIYLLTRFTPLLGASMPGARLALIAGIIGCLIAALLAWLRARRDSPATLSFIALYQLNLALIGWIVLDRNFVGLWIALNLILGIAALAVQQRRSQKMPPWRDTVTGAVAAAALAGLPLTVGFLTRLPIYGSLMSGKPAGGLALILVAESLLVAALLHLWGGFHPQTFHRRSQEKLLPWNTWAAMILLIAPLFIFGLHPPLAAQLAGFPAAESSVFLPLWEQIANGSLGLWAAILLPPVMGYGLYRSELTWPPEMIEIEKQLLSILRLDWLHRALGQLLGRARQFLWGVGAVLHGEGYLAWVALSLLLIFLLVLSR